MNPTDRPRKVETKVVILPGHMDEPTYQAMCRDGWRLAADVEKTAAGWRYTFKRRVEDRASEGD